MILFFHCARTIFECLAFPGRVRALFHVYIALYPTWALQNHISNGVSHVQNRCISQRSLYVLQSSHSLLNYLLKTFLNRHYSLSSAVVNSLYLALPGCWDFQCRRYPLFILLNFIESQNAGAIHKQPCPLQEQPEPLPQTSLSPCQAMERRE